MPWGHFSTHLARRRGGPCGTLYSCDERYVSISTACARLRRYSQLLEMLRGGRKQLFRPVVPPTDSGSGSYTLTIGGDPSSALANAPVGLDATVFDPAHDRAFSRMRQIEASTSSFGPSSLLLARLSTIRMSCRLTVVSVEPAARPRLEPARFWNDDSAVTGTAYSLISAVQDEWDVALFQVPAQGIAILTAKAVIKHPT